MSSSPPRSSPPPSPPERKRGDRPGGRRPVEPRPDPTAAIRERPQLHLAYLLLAVIAVLVIRTLWEGVSSYQSIPYSEFQKLVADGRVAEVVISGDTIQGRTREPLADGKTQFVTRRVEPDLAGKLSEHGIEFESRPESTALPMLLWFLVPMVLIGGLWLLMMRRLTSQMGGSGGLMSIGKSKAKVYVQTDTRTAFEDVAGVDEAKAELLEVVEFLRDPESYGRLGARMPKGILLVGPPGTGKTLLAKAVAGEAKVPFFSISGSEFVEMFVGVGAARVRDLFEQARAQAPCIIFIDELDALGKARNAQPGYGGHDEKEQTLNQLLSELDGFDPSSGIVLLAATNRPEILDPALLRAGRFDRQVLVDRPDRTGRIAILLVHMKRIQMDPDVAPEEIAALTPGFTGADLANLVNEAALVATRRRAQAVQMHDFTQAIERIVAGLEKRNRLINPREREIVAHHEMGHALVAAALRGVDPVHKISIIPRGIGALGYTMQRPTEDRYLMTRDEMESKLAVLQGGRAAELLAFGHYSTGAADDLARATDIARSMVTKYAMVPELGSATYADDDGPGFLGPGRGFMARPYSEATAREIDMAVRRIVDQSFERASTLLARNRSLLESSAKRLLDEETLEGAALREIFDQIDVDPGVAPARSPTHVAPS
jgi:cell division protease FtsH